MAPPKDLRVLGRLGSSLFLRQPSGLGLRAVGALPALESPAWGKSWTSEPSFRRWNSSSSSAPMVGGCLETYLQMKAAGEIKEDPRQEVCMKMLDDLAKQIDSYSPKMTRASSKPASTPASGGGGFFGGLFGGKKAEAPAPKPAAGAPLQPVAGQRGLYLWGGTGTGKTFMMNMLFAGR